MWTVGCLCWYVKQVPSSSSLQPHLICILALQFNLYCPNETDEGRREYKMAYYLTLAERVENLLANGREVIIVGDLNIAHLPIDHCEGVNQRTRQEHLDIHPARQWLDQFLAPNGAFHDVTRKFHPTRKFMYTCWDTVKDTRPANYGVRIDYTLVSRNLLPWIKDADIQPNIYGSDHCPVYVDLRDEIQTQDGKTIRLRDVLLSVPATKRKPPSLATSCWPEFAGRRLQSFFAPKAASSNDKTTQSPSPVPGPGTLLSPAPTPSVETTSTAFVKPSPTGGPSPARAVETASIPRPTTEPCKEVERAEKKSLTQGKSSDRGRTSSATVKSPGQMNLRTFFGQKGTPSSQDGEPQTPLLTGQESSQRITHDEIETQSPEKAYQSDSQTESAVPLFDESTATDDGDSSAGRVTSALAWGSIFAPKEPPLCTFHREPARPWTVNKAGPNHGRKFWMCARPVGSGGTGNPNDDRQFRCSFWKWDSDIRSRQSRQDRGADGLERSFHEVAGKAPRLASGEKRGLERSENRAPHKSAVKRQKK